MKDIWKKKTVNIIFTLFLIINILVPISNAGSTSEIISGVKGFENARQNYVGNGTHQDMEIDSKELKKASNTVYNTLLIIGIVAAVIVGLIIAMQIMAGSAEQKAQTKERLIPYLVGCFVVFGAFGIWKLVLNVLNQTVT